MTDWDALLAEAKRMTKFSYVPYSEYPVGAAAFVDDGRMVSGCNVENASLGMTLCAECGLISELWKSGGGKLVAFLCVNKLGELIMPCGRCRQLLHEHAGEGFVVRTPEGDLPWEQALPQGFGPNDLERVRS